jgi:hypothetical protein
VTDHPQGVKHFGWLQGATEFYDEPGTFIETLDQGSQGQNAEWLVFDAPRGR